MSRRSSRSRKKPEWTKEYHLYQQTDSFAEGKVSIINNLVPSGLFDKLPPDLTREIIQSIMQ
jgi:hypothetical protein